MPIGIIFMSMWPFCGMRLRRSWRVETIYLRPDGALVIVSAVQWHNLKSRESGTVLFEEKDWTYEQLGRGEGSIITN